MEGKGGACVKRGMLVGEELGYRQTGKGTKMHHGGHNYGSRFLKIQITKKWNQSGKLI